MMASELAKKIYQLEWSQIDVIDTELQEVREVLEGFHNSHGCWCPSGDDYQFKPPYVCGENCQRARALMEKLEIK
jgi:hypothetical protein